jgi:hypothetical protein
VGGWSQQSHWRAPDEGWGIEPRAPATGMKVHDESSALRPGPCPLDVETPRPIPGISPGIQLPLTLACFVRDLDFS